MHPPQVIVGFMTLPAFPKHLKECHHIISKLIFSNSGQLKQQQKDITLYFFLWGAKIFCEEHIFSQEEV